MADMTSGRQSGFSLTENGWRALLLGTSVLILIFTVYCLSQGITIVFMHLYYFPIILLAYHYHKKGVILSAVLGILYVALVIFFTYPAMADIYGALVRFVVFVGIALVISFLSENLKNRELERNTIIANSEDGIFVIDLPSQMIAEVNLRGADLLGFTPGDLVNMTLETIWQDKEERATFSSLIKTGGAIRNIEARLSQKNGDTRTVLLSAGRLPGQRVVLTVTDITERERMLSEMLRLSDVRESIIKNANVWLMVLDSRGRILEWNFAAEQISGYPAAEVIGGNEVWKRLYPDQNYRKVITGKITDIITKDNYLENLQTTIVRKNGTKKTILWNTRGLPDKKGGIGSYIAIGVDITDREKVEQVSREYAEWYSTLLRTTRDGYNLVDASGRLIEVNDNYCRMTGFSREELLEKTISDMDADESKDVAFAHMQKIFATGSDRFETRHRTKGGGTIDVEVSVVLQAQKQQIIVFVRDITERKHAEMEISQSEKKFHTVADYTSDWEYWQGENRQIIYMSPSCHNITGYTQQEFLANPDLLVTIVHPDDLASVQEHNNIAWEMRQALSTDFRIIHRDGTVRWIAHACRQVYDNEGKALGRRVSNRDITDRKLLEIRLKENEGRLKEIIESMIAGVVIIDPKTHTIIDLNSVAAKMIGAEKNEIIGSVCYRYTCPAEIGSCPITDLGQTVDNSRNVLLTKNGEKIPILKSVVSIEFNKRPYLLESFIDITDLTRIETALRESEEKFRAFFTTSPDCVFITSREGRWIDFNNTAVELFGYESREELMEVNIADLYAHPDERKKHLEIISEQGFSKDYPVDLRKKDGTIINTLISSVLRRDRNGTIIGFQGVIRDITGLKRVEMVLQQLASVVRYSGELVCVAGLDGKITFLNDAGGQMLGILPADAIGEDFLRFIPDYLNEKIQTEVLPVSMEQGIWKGDLQYINQKSGNLVDVHVMAFTITDPDTGKPQYLANVSLDITDRKRAEEALKTSQILLMEAMNLAHMAYWEFDVPTGVFTFNNRFYNLYGTTAEREGGYQIPADVYAREFVYPDDIPVVSDEINKAIASPDPDYTRQIEHRIIRRDGVVRHIIVRFGITKDAEGRTVKTHGANQDITELKRAEAAIAESFATFRTVMDSLDALVYVADMKTYEILFINQYGRKAWGDLTGRICWESLQVNQESPCPFCTNNKLLDPEGNPTGILIWEFRNTITGKWYECHDSAIQWTDGRIVRLEIATDITERKLTEMIIRESEQKFHAIFDATGDGMLLTNTETQQFVMANRAIQNMTGYTEAELLNLTISDIHPAADLPHVIRQFEKMVHGASDLTLEVPVLRKDGTVFYCDISSSVAVTIQNRHYMLGIFHDITDRKMVEDALRQANKQLNLLSSITRHDINNQLTVLKGYLELSHDVIDNPATLTGYIQKEEQAANAIEHQITFTKDYQELGAAAPVWQNVNANIQKAIAELPMKEVRVEVDPKNPEVFVDRLFEKVFYNLIDNALRYGGEAMKTIRISSQETDTGLRIIFEDDGVGITAEDKKRLFTRGFGKNTGLGLFLSREILAITGITITENGTPGRGARFEMTVPKGMFRNEKLDK